MNALTTVWNSEVLRRVLVALAAVWMLVVPIVGYAVIHDTQTKNAAEITALVRAFGCQQKAFNGLLQDVPLAFANDKNPHDYASIAKGCKVAEVTP